MRIQHNIMAMNAYRNYTNNTSALSKNLEKLSSGYKINRAGDDAAGLAISEKMRAQITGLETAQKNAKDGISLVQTAEGALTEVHDMLNRMYELAEQSANGTYDNDVDRKNLQEELDALRTEINRISQSANFNGIKLFTKGGGDDTLEAAELEMTISSASNAVNLSNVSFAYASAATDEMKKALADAAGSKGLELTFTLASGSVTSASWTKGNTITLTGLPKGYTFEFKTATGGTAEVKDGSAIKIGSSAGQLAASAGLELTMKDGSGNTIGTITIGKPAGAAAAGTSKITLAPKAEEVASPTFTAASAAGTSFGITDIDFASAGLSISATTAITAEFASTGEVLTINVGSKAFTTTLTKATATMANQTISLSDGKGNTISVTFGSTSKIGTDSTSVASTAIGNLTPPAEEEEGGGAVGGGSDNFTLQIGEDGETYNQLTFAIDGISTTDLRIDAIRISSQDSAQAALKTIKDAINQVSGIRGKLGAIQNRLDHTINNLSVMTENIQDAESTIRDTDVADEMMAYTKNNILVQSAQAMLAQANQVPQGVLQLLQ